MDRHVAHSGPEHSGSGNHHRGAEHHRGPEQHHRGEHHEGHHNPYQQHLCGMYGKEGNHTLQQIMRAEEQARNQLTQDLINNGLLPPNPFMNGFGDDAGEQKKGDKGGGLGGILKTVASVAEKVAPIAAMLA